VGALRCLAAYFSDNVDPSVDDMDVIHAQRAGGKRGAYVGKNHYPHP
jgi:hypothetical protein